ncbi:MAG: hypothetical protein ACKOTA_04835, partial [Solirubrobacterales bacterium]
MAAEIMPFENDEDSGSTAPETLLLIPLDDTVVFPTLSVTRPVEVGDDEKVLLAPPSHAEYAGAAGDEQDLFVIS